jgi:hypothetical protein
MHIRERILATLAWREPDRVPLTVYDWMLPRGADERLLRELGAGLITRLPAHVMHHRKVTIETVSYWEQGEPRTRKTLRTPVGAISKVTRLDPSYGSPFILEHYLKTAEDYRVMAAVYEDAVYTDNCEAIRRAQRQIGDDGLVLIRMGKGPIQEILYQYAGLEAFSLHLYDCPDAVAELYDVMARRQEELYALCAGSPVEVIQIGDNIDDDVVSPRYFRRWCEPIYRRLHEALRGTGKLLAVHMDGTLGKLVNEVAAAPFDIVEALTPPPVGDVSVAQARAAWPDKALWLNYTSSVHLEPDAAIAEHTRQLIAEAGSRRGFAISITEDMPLNDWARSLKAIATAINAS